MVRGLLSDDEWAFFEPFVIERGPLRGRPPADHRRTLNVVFWIAAPGRPGATCRRNLAIGTRSKSSSRGGFSTKFHARTNAEGLPIALILTPGEAHDSTAFTDLMAEHDADPAVMLADKGYDSDAIRDEVRARGGTPEIPTKKNWHIQHTVNRTV